MRQKIEYGLDHGNTLKTSKGFVKRGLISIALISLVFSSITTQQIAALFAFNPALGSPLAGAYYAPWRWLVWYLAYKDQYPDAISEIIQFNFNIAILVFGLFAATIYYTSKSARDKHDALHGSAHFATFDDVEKMGLIDDEGIVLGSYIDPRTNKQHILRHDGPEHVLMIAPTGSGKGVSVVNPTLLTWRHSMVVYDLKKENWSLSSRWRKEYANNTVLRFEPACSDGTAASYNPLAEMRLHTDHDIQDAQNIAAIVLEHGDEGSGKSGDTYFRDAAYALLVAYILHTCYEQHNAGNLATLSDVADTLSDPSLDFESLLKRMKTTKHCNNAPHPLCMHQASSLLNMLGAGAGKQFAGIQGVVESKLSLYADPIVRRNITASDFKVSDLMSRDNPVTLYICVGSTDKSRLKPLTKLLLTQIVRNLTKEVEFSSGVSAPTYKHKLLMLIDEFPSLGKMSIVNEAIAFLRGYGIRCLLIIQDFNQLRSDDAYGRNEAITANCGVQIAFTPNIYPTADEISKKVGTTTVTKREVSMSGGKNFWSSSNASKSIREVSRPLLTPDEIMRLPTVRKINGEMIPGDELVLIAGQPPIYGRQILHFTDAVLSQRAALGALNESDVIKK